jgi:hypothetical protein
MFLAIMNNDPYNAAGKSNGKHPHRRDQSANSVVPDGLRFHQQQVLHYGPFMSLVVPAIAGFVAGALLYGSETTWRGIIGFLAALIALPTLPIFGLPLADGAMRWLLTAASSFGLWLLLGHIAARRAARKMAASWPEWRQQWWRLAIGVWLGSLLGMAVAGGYLLLVN